MKAGRAASTVLMLELNGLGALCGRCVQAGGGGTGDARKAKIKSKNESLADERRKRHEKVAAAREAAGGHGWVEGKEEGAEPRGKVAGGGAGLADRSGGRSGGSAVRVPRKGPADPASAPRPAAAAPAPAPAPAPPAAKPGRKAAAAWPRPGAGSARA
jgi:hypothetical protein